jgi:predicted O-methyltransferase YrrM
LNQGNAVDVIDSRHLQANGRHINAWELKAYGIDHLSRDFDVLIGIDSDCLLCSPVDDLIARCHATGGFLGGRDGNGASYDESYAPYGITAHADNPKYMSTSLFFMAATEENRHTAKRWAECCNSAVFNSTGPHPGHGDQGVLNAVLYSEDRSERVQLLENALWSQHWVYWDTISDLVKGQFINRSAGGERQRAFHCGGAEKFWSLEHRQRVVNTNALQTYPYVWYLAMLWFGKCSSWNVDPFAYLPDNTHHLVEDLVNFLPEIFQVYPLARRSWDGLTEPLIERVSAGVPRAMSLGGGSMSELIRLVADNPQIRRYVEVGSYEGGSLLALALRFANRDVDFYSVESFMGNLNGTMDGHCLPVRTKFLSTFAKYPGLRARLVPGQSVHAAALFDDASLDMVFIDACHDTEAVLKDIDVWTRKLVPRGILAGDDYGWESVSQAVHERLGAVNATPSGHVWWKQL